MHQTNKRELKVFRTSNYLANEKLCKELSINKSLNLYDIKFKHLYLQVELLLKKKN